MIVLIGIIIVAAIGYFVSLRLHPLTRCSACNGGSRHFGSIYTGAFRRCRKCGGTGRQDRLGTRLFFGGTGGTGDFSRR